MVALLSCRESGRRVAGRLRCLFVAAAALLWGAFASGTAQGNTINIVNGAGTTIGSLTTSSSILGYIATSGCGVDNVCQTTDSPFSTSLISANEFVKSGCSPSSDPDSLCNSNPETEAAALNIIAGTSFATGTQSGNNPANPFNIATLYFSLKIGNGWAFFKNDSGGVLSLTYAAVASEGAGLSHYTTFGAAVPGPIVGAGLPGLLLACGGLFLLARRRRLSALPA